MGKGGDQSVTKPSSGKSQKLRLEHMQTEELRKWAKAYGINSDKDRDFLLKELVRRWHGAFLTI
jgi:hypothetical protein